MGDAKHTCTNSVLLILLVLATAGLVGCGSDSCSIGESRCFENAARVCSGPNDLESGNHFNTLGVNCGLAACLDVIDSGLRVAVCSTSKVEDPRCGIGLGSICVDGSTQLLCDHGYSGFQKQCTNACVLSAGTSGGFCTLSGITSPACRVGSGPECGGTSVVTCREGYATARSVCGGTGARCVPASGGFMRAYCVSTAACAGPNDVFCYGPGEVAGCYGGAQVAMKCDIGSVCNEYGTVATGREAECVVR